MVVRKVGKYEVGRTIGEGTFAKVKFAQNTETGESVAMKVLDRSTIIKHKMVDQVIASRTKIYIVLEFITGGELFDKIVHHGRLSESESRRYFQQLIDGVDYCHSKGVYHRDLKPENLLLDSQANLKISDFGLSAFPGEGVNLLRTTCGTPNYVAPEVLSHKGYNGALADVWSCGVILYVLMAGYLPFDEIDLTTLYGKIENAQFSCPSWFSVGAKSLIRQILDPNPETRIRIEDIRQDEWFKKNYNPVKPAETEEYDLDDVNAAFDDHEVSWFCSLCLTLDFTLNVMRILAAAHMGTATTAATLPTCESSETTPLQLQQTLDACNGTNVTPLSINYTPTVAPQETDLPSLPGLPDPPDPPGLHYPPRLPGLSEEAPNEQCGNNDMEPLILNAFDLIILSQGLNLSALFDRRQDSLNHQTRFVSQKPGKVVLSSMEVVAQSMGFKTHIRNYKMRVEGLSADRTSHFSVIVEIFRVAPTYIMVDIQKAAGDAEEYLKFYKNFCNNLDDIIWKPPDEMSKSKVSKTKSRRR
ncbi:hypothetical protein BUALT_Bualt15G0123100 [Buddleja alternifolia]|uniref:non-specific serine/threonine protein kinase n=1 Tax=Buddleja alternifolia TaxID=168488 RepID=A0AAV6WNN5_9LAMI|nr:hypothetical protein BUALT_Bualt15G0123100 [Buddleja alternifolia]